MHVLQPKHIILKREEAKKLLEKLNVSRSQLPKIKKNDSGLPKEAKVGDIVKIMRKNEKGEEVPYYRVVIP